MEELPISAAVRRLTPGEIEQFNEWGYLQGLPVFDVVAVPRLQKRLHELEALMPVGVLRSDSVSSMAWRADVPSFSRRTENTGISAPG